MIFEAELRQTRRTPQSIMEIYGHERAPTKVPALMGRGGAAKGASFRDASRKRDDPELVPTKRSMAVFWPERIRDSYLVSV